VTYTVSDMVIDAPFPTLLSSVMKLGGQGIHGGIRDGKLVIANGIASNNFSVDIVRYKKAKLGTAADPNADTKTYPSAVDEQGNALTPVSMPLGFSGDVNLVSGALKQFAIKIPQPLLDLIDRNLAKNLPAGLVVPVTGNNGHPTLDIGRALLENAAPNLLGGAAGKLLNGGKGNNASDDSSNNPLGKLGDLLGKKKKKNPDNNGGGN
jgi:hypothetical protein